MKFSLAVAEFNPFHNGHKILIDGMKREGDAVVVIMSGNFCQRGEAAVAGKYARARHAVLSGADVVLELPTVFATAPAEIFAKGAIKLLSGIRGDKTLFFGTETGEKEDFILLADKLLGESKEYKAALKKELSTGAPYALACVNALKTTEEGRGLNFDVLDNPNSVLGLEYAKAIKFFGSDMDIRPIKRDNNYLSTSLVGEVCSALAIREALAGEKKKKIKGFVPKHVYADLNETTPTFDEIAIFKILENKSRKLREITDCTEGLENRIKAFAGGVRDLNELIDKLETRRYTRARLKRIIVNNMLGIERSFVDKCLKSNLYLKVLAVASDKKDVLSALSGGKNKLVTRKADFEKLTGTARSCFEKDAFCNDVYNLVSGTHSNEFEMKVVLR